MRIVRSRYEHEWYPPNPDFIGCTEERNYSGWSSLESRILFNPVETKLIDAARWLVYYFWAERIVDPILLLRCRWFGKHSRACRGRRGHRRGHR